MGRHVIGYEVQKVLAAVDWIKRRAGPDAKVGVAGYGEGGLIAFYAAAADPRIDAALVSGYFGPRQRVWAEPIYRNVWGLLREFGDAEIATLDRPARAGGRAQRGPARRGPARRAEGAARRGRGRRARHAGAGRRPSREWKRLDALLPAGFQERVLVHGDGGAGARLRRPGGRAGSSPGCSASRSKTELPEAAPADRRQGFDAGRAPAAPGRGAGRTTSSTWSAEPTRRATRSSSSNTTLIRTLRPAANGSACSASTEQSAEVFAREVAPFRKILAEEVIGRIDDPVLAARPALAQGLRHAEVDRLRGGARRLPRRLRLGRAAGAEGHQGRARGGRSWSASTGGTACRRT